MVRGHFVLKLVRIHKETHRQPTVCSMLPLKWSVKMKHVTADH